MIFRKSIFLSAIFLSLMGVALNAADKAIGVVNFSTCITDSKYGKLEQEQMDKMAQQISSIIEETEKELKGIQEKFEDQDYMDGLSPEAEQEMKMKGQALNDDLMKYHNQRYQAMQQAEYFFMQKMILAITKASETVSADKHLDLIMRKEVAFYSNPNMDITKLVIDQMDKNFDEDAKKREETPKNSSK